MKAALTVLLCSFGLGLVYRVRWYKLLPFAALQVFQVILLNVLRITSTVLVAPRMPSEWADNFLHDTLGVFLVVGIVLTHLEMVIWQSVSSRRLELKEGVARGEYEVPERATTLPGIWRIIVRWGPLTIAPLLLVALLSVAAYKKRPQHRLMMIKGTIPGLLKTDPLTAVRACDVVLALGSDVDREALSLKAKALAFSGSSSEALGILETLESQDPDLVEQIRRLMFIFEDIMLVNDKGIQMVLKEIDGEDLALALKTASEELMEKVFRNMSDRASELIKEDMEYMGPVRISDVEGAQQKIVDVVRRLEDSGVGLPRGRG